MAAPKRQPKGASNGGQFAPDRSGMKPPTSAPVIPTQNSDSQLEQEHYRLQRLALFHANMQLRARREEDFYDSLDDETFDALEKEWPLSYHKRFTSFPEQTLQATKDLFAAQPSTLSPEERKVVFEKWVKTISKIYDMNTPKMLWDDGEEIIQYAGGGVYSAEHHAIFMSTQKMSITTLLHETRHALQYSERGPDLITTDIERDARAWSLSLYYQVKPDLLEKLVKEGRIFHISPEAFNN